MTAVLVVCGFKRETLVGRKADTRHLAALGAVQIDCLECGGTGVWDFMAPEIPASPCIQCKGTGKEFIGG